jgi:O-acetyl-ADP-ribose deacetylase (regulator of RNase III)
LNLGEVAVITYVDISLFDSPAQTLVNTVNTVGAMGKGIAADFKRLYPDMYQEYHRLCLNGKLKVGMLYVYRTPNKIIVNFPTKEHWRYPSKVEYIDLGLQKFVSRYQDYGISSVSFPQLGCGHGELYWEKQVKPLMENYLKNLPIPVYIHLYRKPAEFVPERLDPQYAKQVRLERQRISSDQFWQDLRNLTSHSVSSEYQMDLFGPKIEIDDEVIRLLSTSSDETLIYREDIEDLWNTLRIRGTIQESDIPIGIQNTGASNWLLDFLERLSYIQPIHLRSHNHRSFTRGLRYDPQPEATPVKHNEIVAQ